MWLGRSSFVEVLKVGSSDQLEVVGLPSWLEEGGHSLHTVLLQGTLLGPLLVGRTLHSETGATLFLAQYTFHGQGSIRLSIPRLLKVVVQQITNKTGTKE
jgi:hypothetical protein